MLGFLAGTAWANPLPNGSATTTFVNGGTLSGSFTLTPGTSSITTFDLTSTAYGVSQVFSPASGGGVGISLTNDNNTNMNQVLGFDQSFTNNPTTNIYEVDIVVQCHGVANCLTHAARGTAFALDTGTQPCPPQALHCIPAGEQTPLALAPSVLLSPGFLLVTDPPGSLALNVSSTLPPGYTLFNGGGTSNVPEPPVLALMALGLAGLAVARRKSII
jgi:hypothetical protein